MRLPLSGCCFVARWQVALAAFNEDLQQLRERGLTRDVSLGSELIGALQELFRHGRSLLR